MNDSNATMDRLVEAYMNAVLGNGTERPELWDLKEELMTHLHDAIADHLEGGMDPERAFAEAVVSLGDVSGLAARESQERAVGRRRREAGRQPAPALVARHHVTASHVAVMLVAMAGAAKALYLWGVLDLF